LVKCTHKIAIIEIYIPPLTPIKDITASIMNNLSHSDKREKKMVAGDFHC
jgi:hypothetical protein